MVTCVQLPNIVLDGERTVRVWHQSDDILGKVFRFESEELVANEPGLSYFIYTSLDGQSQFKERGPSQDLQWNPTEEQLQNVLTVTGIGPMRTGMSFVHNRIALSNGVLLAIEGVGDPLPNWTQVGNRFLQIQPDLYVDLDTRLVISSAGNARPIRNF